MNIDPVLGPVHFQASPDIRPYPKKRDPAKSCTRIAFQAVLKPLLWGCNKMGELIQAPMRKIVFYASTAKFHAKLNPQRLEESRQLLRDIGGTTQVIKTSDHVVLETMYFNVEAFRQRFVHLGGQFSAQGPRLYVYTTKLKNICEKVRIPLSRCLVRGWSADLPRFSDGAPRLQDRKPGITILTQGNACIFEFDRARIAETLLSGQHCMVFNIRGTGRSKGSPSETGSYKDLEAVYQYVTQVKGFYNKQITVIGYCLGGGASTELAKNHPGVALTMDRCFISMGDMIAVHAVNIVSEQLKLQDSTAVKLQRFSRTWLKPIVDRCIFGYNNARKLRGVKGAVCVLDASRDDVIPQDAGPVLRQARRTQVQTDITLAGGHCDPWDEPVQVAYRGHLERTGSARTFGDTQLSAAAQDASLYEMRSWTPLGATQATGLHGSRLVSLPFRRRRH